MSTLVLTGIDGANPLGFLAAVGTALIMCRLSTDVRICWQVVGGAWRPILSPCEENHERFAELLHEALSTSSSDPFEIDKRLPFPVNSLVPALHRAQNNATPQDRRLADFLAAFGSEIFVDDKDKESKFEGTSFCMVRTGDSKGQGLSHYALAIRHATDAEALRRSLFDPWNYQDIVFQDREKKNYSLRWDPIEDQRYALVWHNPEDKSKKTIKTMLGANALALEALILFPTAPRPRGLATTGFFQAGRREFFTWPIWMHPVSPEMLRSLVSLTELHCEKPRRQTLAARGIAEIYRCERIPNGYYKNFSPSIPA